MKTGILTLIVFWIICLNGYAHEGPPDSGSVRYGALADFFVHDKGFRMEFYLPAYVLESLYGFHLNFEETEKQGVLSRQNSKVCQLEKEILKRLHVYSKGRTLDLKISDLHLISFSYLFLKIEIQPPDSKMDSFEFYYDTPGDYDKSDRLAVSLYQGQDKSGGAKNIAYLYGNRKKLIYRNGLSETSVSREGEPFRPGYFLLVFFLASGYGFLSLFQMVKENRRAA